MRDLSNINKKLTALVNPKNFMATLYLNVNNARLTDKAFREFVRNTLNIVEFTRPEIDIVFASVKLPVAKKVFTRLTKKYPSTQFGLGMLERKGVVWVRQGLLSKEEYAQVAMDAGEIYDKITKTKKRR